MVLPFCIQVTCVPCGAAGLPEVTALPLPATPAAPVNVHGEPVGSISQLLPTLGNSNPGSLGCVTELGGGDGGGDGGGAGGGDELPDWMLTWSSRAVLPPTP